LRKAKPDPCRCAGDQRFARIFPTQKPLSIGHLNLLFVL